MLVPLETWSAALVGKVLAGRYRVTDVLGSGGVGAVFGAEHIAVGRRVALKVLHPEMLAHGSVVERFHREARAAAACAREGVVDVLDLDHDPACGPFLVMEHLEGETLSARLRRSAPLPLAETLRIVHAILDTLAAVHARGIIHRDLKPANVMLARSPEGREVVKILDFGLAREVVGASKPALTLPGSVLGTPRFMAPEQAAGDPTVDARADLYAVGAILYCCLGGRPPYSDVPPDEALHAVLLRSPLPIERLRPDLPTDLVATVSRAMARDRADRFSDAASLRAALERAVPGYDESSTLVDGAMPASLPIEPALAPARGDTVPTSAVRAPIPATPPAPMLSPSPQIAVAAGAPRKSRALLWVVAIGATASIVCGLVAIAVIAPAMQRSSESSPAPLAEPPVLPPISLPAPIGAPPLRLPPAPVSPLVATAAVGAMPGVIPQESGLRRASESSEINCSWGTHVLSAITLDLPERAIWLTGDCNLTCANCTLIGADDVVYVAGSARLTLIGSSVTARAGAALHIGPLGQATIGRSRLTGRIAAHVGGVLTTQGTVYSGELQRPRGGSVVDQGGNTGLR